MILTCTPNPSVDRTLEVPELALGGIISVRSSSTQAGGKGVNVSRALRRNGIRTTAVMPVGGAPGSELVALLDDLPHIPVPIASHTRSNVTVTEAGGTTTKLNSTGPDLTLDEVDALLAAVENVLARGPDWLVASGSLPSGTPVDLYAHIEALAAAYNVPVALDTSGKPLEAATAVGSFALLKPNLEELTALWGDSLSTVGDAVAAARELIGLGNRTVLVTLGSQGAMLVDGERTWWGRGPSITPRSTVGAGDCALAGYLSGEGSPPERLRRAVAWGTAAIALPGTTVPGPEEVRPESVSVVANPPESWHLAEL